MRCSVTNPSFIASSAADPVHFSIKSSPGAIFASAVIPSDGPIAQRRQARQEWFATVRRTLESADIVFVDPDNGLEPTGYSPGSSKAGKSILLSELHELARPGRCLIAYHHHTRRKGGHHGEIEHWANRLQAEGFATVDAIRARPYSPRVLFLLDAPPDIRQRAEQIEPNWQGWITWHPQGANRGTAGVHRCQYDQSAPTAPFR